LIVVVAAAAAVVVVFVVVVVAVVNRNTAAAAGRRLDVVGLNDIPACAYPPENALMLWISAVNKSSQVKSGGRLDLT
jgi:hypothetical protein